MAASLSSLSSMEMMLDALMQRGIGKPEEKPKDEAPPALPTRPTARGRLPSLQRTGTADAVPWNHRPLRSPQRQEEENAKCAVNLELERRAEWAEEELKQRDEEIAGLKQQIEHYEARCSEYESKMKSVEGELQKQIAALQMAQNAPRRSGESAHHRQDLAAGGAPPCQAQVRKPEEAPGRQPRGSDAVAVDERQAAVSRLAKEFRQQSQAFENGALVLVEARPAQAGHAADELRKLKSQFGAWKKEYKARLRRAKADLKKLVYSSERGGARRCRWRLKAPKCLKDPAAATNLRSASCCCC